ncbi:7TM diverse intracellular signaling domain-containing protein [Paraburkholderia sp. Ac-20342]|uniref:sensor histidine kinase n=1 Tax=Paraburkholderia sp. Ac-20342 TaxID=2703889 RepID=UPI00321800F4
MLLWLLWACGLSAWAQAPAPARCPVEVIAAHAAEATADGGRPAAADWRPVTLPDEWNRRYPDAPASSVWYRVEWRRACSGSGAPPVALLLSSVVLAGEVYVNDHYLFSDEHLSEPLSRSWNMPRNWVLPDAWLHDGMNTLWVRAVSVPGQDLGLGPVILGDPRDIQRQHDRHQWRYRTLFAISAIVSAVIGVLFFCLWIVRRDQRFYGWYAASSLFWVVFIANVLATSPWPLSSSLMVARVNTMALLLSATCFCLFTWRFAKQVLPRLERALWTVTAALLVVLAGVPDAYTGCAQRIGFSAASAIFLLNCVQFLFHAWRTRRREHGWLAVCLLVLPVAALHDLLVLTGFVHASPVFPYANIVNTLALSAILGLRHARNLRRIERFNQELAEGIEQARSEVARSLERDHALTLANTRLQDRLQIAHDLHDGLGGAVFHMMASVEQGAGPLPRPQVLSMLKFIRDDLRHTIDSNSSAHVSVPAIPQEWIAPLRHRYTTLFDEPGIASEWHVPPSWRTPPNALQYLALTRLVEEALTNVIKHSRARRVRLHLAQSEPHALALEIEDDGVGFDVAAVRQADISTGIRSMSVRIASVGGTLDVQSEPRRTVLTVRMKLSPP